MRDLNECKAEVFRRSENRIKQHRQRRKKVLSLCIPLCLCAILCLTALPAGRDKSSNAEQSIKNSTVNEESIAGKDERNEFSSAENFAFSLTWGAYGISSYDSETGALVKTNQYPAVNPAAKPTNAPPYTTNYQLTPAQEEKIFQLIKELDITS